MFKLHFENQVFVTVNDFEKISLALPDYAIAAFSFCKSWLQGEHHFTQFTSGSTGIPKEISLSRHQMIASAQGTGDFFGIDSNSILLCCLNPSFIAGKMMLVRAMVWDCEIYLVEPKANPLLGLNQTFDFAAMVPLQVETSLQDSDSRVKLKEIRNLIIGGAPLSTSLKSELVNQGVSAWQTFGMTETVSHIALARISESELLYQALPGVEIGQDDRGALWVKSSMSGTDPIQTNDLIELRSKNSFIWLGRTDFVINSAGIKYNPELLEEKSRLVLEEIYPGTSFFFFGEKDPKLGEQIVLILEATENSRLKILKERLKEVLHKYEMPRKFYFSKHFARTESGKLNRIQTFNSLC